MDPCNAQAVNGRASYRPTLAACNNQRVCIVATCNTKANMGPTTAWGDQIYRQLNLVSRTHWRIGYVGCMGKPS